MNLSEQVASFKTTGSYVTLNNVVQTSGQSVNDFTNPLTYTVHAADGSTQNYTVTATLKAEFFMVGANSIINKLTIGSTIEYSNEHIPLLPIYAITENTTKIVATGSNGAIFTSTNGDKWKTVVSGTTVNLRGIVYADGKFVIVGNNGMVLTSSDGETWTSLPIIEGFSLNGITAIPSY